MVDQIDIANKSPLATFSRQISKLAFEAERGLSFRGTCVLARWRNGEAVLLRASSRNRRGRHFNARPIIEA